MPVEYNADGLDSKVILINGVQLAELMFEYGVGVSTVNSYVMKRIDSDFFEDKASIASEAAAGS
jgi:restriction system protein